MKRLVLYNRGHMGDVYHSHGQLNWIAKYLSDSVELWHGHWAVQNTLLHPRINKLLLTVEEPFLVAKAFDWKVEINNRQQSYVTDNNNTLYINCWLATSPSFNACVDGCNKDYHDCIFGCVSVYMVYEQTVEIIDLINNHFNEAIPYPTSIVDLIPKLPSSIKNKDIADTLLDKVKNYRKSVLLCNGHVNSSQSPPFNLSERINNLVLTNPDCAFIYTTKERDAIAANEYFIDDYLPERPNIDEIRYISTFCDILVSKMSGPGSAICLHENFFDDKKTLICLTDYESLAYWYREGVCNYDWTNDYSEQSISNMISKYLNVTKE